MADTSFRVLLDFRELNLKFFKFVWMSISPRDLKTIKDLKIAILNKFSFDQVDLHLFLQDGLLPEDENVVVLRENDVIRLQYAALLNSVCEDPSITNSLIPASVPHDCEEIDSKKEKCSKKRKRKSHLSPPSIAEKNKSLEKREESNKKKIHHLSCETSTPNNTTSKNLGIINPSVENVGMKDISCTDSLKLKNDNGHNCKKKKKRKCSHSDNQNNSSITNENEIIFSEEIITILNEESSLKFIESTQAKEQKVGKKESSKTLENCKSSEVVLCSLPASISDKNFTECENINIPTVDLEINSEKKPTQHDERNETVTSNSECILRNTSSPILGNNCKKKKRKRHRKRKPMLTDSPFSECASFNSDSTVADKAKTLDDALHVSSQHMNYSSSEKMATTEKISYLSSSDHCGTETTCNLFLSTPAAASQNNSKEIFYNELCNKNEVTPNLISSVPKPYSPDSISSVRSNFSAVPNKASFPLQSGDLPLGTASKTSPTKTNCETKDNSSPNGYKNKFPSLRIIKSPILADYSSDNRHLKGADKPSASVNIFVTKTSTPLQQTDYSSKSCHLETASKSSLIKTSCMNKNTFQSNVYGNNSSPLRSIKSSPVQTNYSNFNVETTSTKVSHSAPLNSFPAAGTHIAYKILELDEAYSPVVSEYKEGIVTKVFPETDELEIELIRPEVKFGRIGKFENIYDEDEPPPTEVIRTVHLKWSSLIDPIRRIV